MSKYLIAFKGYTRYEFAIGHGKLGWAYLTVLRPRHWCRHLLLRIVVVGLDPPNDEFDISRRSVGHKNCLNLRDFCPCQSTVSFEFSGRRDPLTLQYTYSWKDALRSFVETGPRTKQ
jgi:hypothetical protein